jgi:hypothetical protein
MDSLFAALRYGSLGLSAILAVLAYRLLQNEQRVEKPRSGLLKAIRTFLVFALVLALVGAVTEIIGRRQASNTAVLPQDFSTWTVSGQFQSPEAGRPMKPVITVTPLLQTVNPDGSFWTVIPVQRGTPSAALALNVDLQGPYLTEVVHLGARDTLFGQRYRIRSDTANHEIKIIDTVRFTKVAPYAPGH